MMNLRSFVLVAGLAVGSLAGCSASSEEAGAASSDVVEGAADVKLADQTLIKGTITVGETSKVAYEPGNYTFTSYKGVPYLAWELVLPAAKTGAGLETQSGPIAIDKFTIDVAGQFPGLPDVLVVDEDFTVLGATKGQTTELGETATLTIDATGGKKLVLVRDMIWVAPMSFDISVTQ